MAIVKIIKGDLINEFKLGTFQAIGHGANCKNLMGAGIARQIAAEIPEAFQADAEFYTRMGGVDNKACPAMAGHVSVAHRPEGQVFNLYTQIQTGAHASYQLLQSACEELNKFCKQRQITRVGLPLVGAGIGGLDIIAALTIIGACTPDIDVTIVVWHEDEIAWKKSCLYRNYGFPQKFDGTVIRTGQNSFKFWRKDWKEAQESILDIAGARMMWEAGETAVSFSDQTVELWLLVADDSEALESAKRLY